MTPPRLRSHLVSSYWRPMTPINCSTWPRFSAPATTSMHLRRWYVSHSVSHLQCVAPGSDQVCVSRAQFRRILQLQYKCSWCTATAPFGCRSDSPGACSARPGRLARTVRRPHPTSCWTSRSRPRPIGWFLADGGGALLAPTRLCLRAGVP